MMQVSSILEGVELGQFITKTHMGRLFRGVYNGEPVTIKVGLPALKPHLLILSFGNPPLTDLHRCLWQPLMSIMSEFLLAVAKSTSFLLKGHCKTKQASLHKSLLFSCMCKLHLN